MSNQIENYQYREQQLLMAASVLEAIEKGEDMVCEVGTGVGKTLAYLLPVLDSKIKTLVVTASKTLQQQLIEKDLPLACRVAKISIDYAMLKGKENYLCVKRLNQALEDVSYLTAKDRQSLLKIHQWAQITATGDIAECSDVPPNSAVWKLVCTRHDDSLDEDDFYIQMRKQAKQAKVLVINHHLLCAELMLAEDRLSSSILDQIEYVIVDEAHRLKDTATMMFSETVSRQSLQTFVQDAWQIISEENLASNFSLLMQKLGGSIEEISRYFFQYQLGRYRWRSFYEHTEIEWLSKLIDQLEAWEACAQKTGNKALNTLVPSVISQLNLLRTFQALSEPELKSSDAVHDSVAWVSTTQKKGFQFYVTPVQVAPVFQQYCSPLSLNWLFTSATLAVADSFDHFFDDLGLPKTTQHHRWHSPFDYQKQVMWYQPSGLDDLSSEHYIDRFISVVLPICELCGGRTFLLFCSYKSLHLAEEILRESTDFNLFVQGTSNNEKLIQKFRGSERAILLGVSSFWEGVDVRGQQLSFIAIDKLPFSSPGDPLTQACIEWRQRNKQNPFEREILPKAIVALRQGLGRLIRDASDYGIVLIGDNRLYKKIYGKRFLASFPAYRTTTQLEEVKHFWEENQVKYGRLSGVKKVL